MSSDASMKDDCRLILESTTQGNQCILCRHIFEGSLTRKNFQVLLRGNHIESDTLSCILDTLFRRLSFSLCYYKKSLPGQLLVDKKHTSLT